MDPDVTLAAIRAALREALEAKTQIKALKAYAVAADHMETLDNWITKGGFLPTAWCGAIETTQLVDESVRQEQRSVRNNLSPPPNVQDDDGYTEPQDYDDEMRMMNQEFPFKYGGL